MRWNSNRPAFMLGRLFLLASLSCLKFSCAEHMGGWVNTSMSVLCVGKFCYRSTRGLNQDDRGTVSYSVTYPTSMTKLKLLMFYEGLENWNSDMKESWTCPEYVALAEQSGNIFPINAKEPIGTDSYQHNGTIPFATSYDRFFFFVLANCDSCDGGDEVCMNEGPLQEITFQMHATNAYMEPFEEISFDEVISPPFTYAALGASLLTAAIQIYGSVTMMKAGMFHHTVTLLQVALHFRVLGYLANTVMYLQLQTTGETHKVWIDLIFPAVLGGLPLAQVIGFVIGRLTKRHLFTTFMMGLALWPFATLGLCFVPADVLEESHYDEFVQVWRTVATLCFRLSDWTFLMLLILLAKGWTIVRRTLKAQSQMFVAVFMSVNMVAIIFSVSMDAFYSASSMLIHYWQTAAGIAILALQLVFYFWFVQSTVHTMTRFRKQKGRFYIKFFLFYSGWLLCLPVLLLILAHVMSITILRSMLYGCEHGLSLAAQLGMVFMYFPNAKCNRGFPFHAMIVHMKAEKALRKKDMMQLDNPGSTTVGGVGRIKGLHRGQADEDESGDDDDEDNNDVQPGQGQGGGKGDSDRGGASTSSRGGAGTNKSAAVTPATGNEKFLVQSNVLTVNPLLRCRVKLDAVQFRIHRLKMSVDSALMMLDSMDQKANPTKKAPAKAATGQEPDPDEADDRVLVKATHDGKGPVVSRATRAAQRFQNVQTANTKEGTGTRDNSSNRENFIPTARPAPAADAFQTMELKRGSRGK